MHKLIHPVGSHLQFPSNVDFMTRNTVSSIFTVPRTTSLQMIGVETLTYWQFNSANFMPFYHLYLYVFVIRFTSKDFKTWLTRFCTASLLQCKFWIYSWEHVAATDFTVRCIRSQMSGFIHVLLGPSVSCKCPWVLTHVEASPPVYASCLYYCKKHKDASVKQAFKNLSPTSTSRYSDKSLFKRISYSFP
jgi:hypothetical protein